MRLSASTVRRLSVGFGALLLAVSAIVGSRVLRATPDAASASVTRAKRPASTTTSPSTTAPSTTTSPPPVAPAAAPPVSSGSQTLDALLVRLAPVLFEGGAQVRYGFNPRDCCHAGGYDHELNLVWVSERATVSSARLTYVAAHELAHSLHLRSARGPALTAAVAGAPVVRPGPMDYSEKVADCVAWVLYPSETAAAGITYWDCPDPWRAQVRAALR